MTDVIMPQMGESIAEGTVTKWLKNVGDRVERDEPLFEISTDKVDAEIPVARRRRAHARSASTPGATVPIHTVVAVIAAEGRARARRGAPSPARHRRRHPLAPVRPPPATAPPRGTGRGARRPPPVRPPPRRAPLPSAPAALGARDPGRRPQHDAARRDDRRGAAPHRARRRSSARSPAEHQDRHPRDPGQRHRRAA